MTFMQIPSGRIADSSVNAVQCLRVKAGASPHLTVTLKGGLSDRAAAVLSV